jgi:hypothetical protein
LGIYIHNQKNSKGITCGKGKNPFDDWTTTRNGQKVLLSSIYPTYDWVNNSGYSNMGNWIEDAAEKAGK